jgi:hypothetical protein
MASTGCRDMLIYCRLHPVLNCHASLLLLTYLL